MNDIDIFKNSIKDLLTAKMLKFSILPLVISMLVLYTLFFVVAGVGLDSLGTLAIQSSQTTMENGVEHTDNFSALLQGSSIIQFLMHYSFTSWIASFLVYTVGSFLTLYVSIFVAVIVVGFLTPYILKELHSMHYSDVEMIGFSNIIESLLLMLKWTFTMILLFFLLIPLYFIPVLNIIAFNLPLYYFFHKMMHYDIASNILTREENKEIRYKNSNRFRLQSLLLYVISLIPFAIFFAAVFFVIYLGNSYFLELKKIRKH
jgi:hypothetical protein